MERFGCDSPGFDFTPRYNVAPSQTVPVVISQGGGNRLQEMRWGLVPYWAKDISIGSRMINARIETVHEKPAFKNSLLRKRCIIPADGYYEWLKTAQGKTPMRVVSRSGEIFGMAGLWDAWQDEEGRSLTTFTILTTKPANSIEYIHNRMPAVLDREAERIWLNGPADTSPGAVADFLAKIKCEQELEAYPVTNLVNSPANDMPEVVRRA